MSAKQRYRVVEKIDSGGMAEIFRGSALSLDGIEKTVAIKRVRPHLASNTRFIRMFIDEARLAMRLNHANITQVFDVGRAQDTYFLVMEMVLGINVRRMMQIAAEKGYRIPVEISLHVMIGVCEALAHAHSLRDANGKPLNLVHRDVSPPNILISRQGEVKLTDFGLAKAASHLEITDPGVVKGKFSYLSPEAADGKDVDARADIFSCGIVLHEMLTGRRLFMGKTDMETVDLVRQCQIPPPSAFNPDSTRDLDDIVLKALEKDRKKRYQSARDLVDDLASYLFSHNLKVTSFDLARVVQELLDEEMGQAAPQRIVDIVREEIINLSSVGKLPGLTSVDGALPLDLADFPSRRTPFEDVWKEIDSNVPHEGSSVVKLEEAVDVAHSGEEARQVGSNGVKKRGTAVALALLAVLGVSAAVVLYLLLTEQIQF